MVPILQMNALGAIKLCPFIRLLLKLPGPIKIFDRFEDLLHFDSVLLQFQGLVIHVFFIFNLDIIILTLQRHLALPHKLALGTRSHRQIKFPLSLLIAHVRQKVEPNANDSANYVNLERGDLPGVYLHVVEEFGAEVVVPVDFPDQVDHEVLYKEKRGEQHYESDEHTRERFIQCPEKFDVLPKHDPEVKE